MSTPWKIQKDLKFRDHDLAFEDIPKNDISSIKSHAIQNFVYGAETDQASLIIDSFMGYLTQKGYRIVKKDKL